MSSPSSSWTGFGLLTLLEGAVTRRERLMRGAVALMAVAATIWLSYESWRLLFQSDRMGAIDLRIFGNLVASWFSGKPMYGEVKSALYPPASYPLLWPFVGWLSFSSARWLWAAITAASLAWFARLMVRESGASNRTEQAFVVLLLLSIYPTGATIGNGQLITLILPLLVTGILLLARRPGNWWTDLSASALILIALVKPTVSAPFLWAVLLAPGGLRPFLLISTGYVGLTLFATSFQPSPLPTLLYGWLSGGAAVAAEGGSANLSLWLAAIDLNEWMLPASLLAFLGLGVWTYHHRQMDPWLGMAVAAMVARFWSYHSWYDDLLLLVPMIALFRLSHESSLENHSRVMAGSLLAAMVAAMIAPGGLFLLPPPLNMVYVAGQVAVWACVLVFLLHVAGSLSSKAHP